MIRIMDTAQVLEMLRKRAGGEGDDSLREQVAAIIEQVRAGGDDALCSITGRLDGCVLAPDDLKVGEEELEEAVKKADPNFLRALRKARDNIREYHEKQKINSWFDCGREGVLLGQMVRPLERVGIYVPGGKASYPSSVLMNAIPAIVAGVSEIAMTTPPGKDGSVNIHTLAAAYEAGVKEVYRVGGAQAVAALAFGTDRIKRVDKITGPGNRYVTMAKRLVYGAVDIDMLAGPSEILVVADSSANPVYVAADLLSQAEHDEMAAVVLITPDRTLALAVVEEVSRQIKLLERSAIAVRSVSDYGAIVITENIEEALELANSIAPEHLELAVSDPFAWLGMVKAAGAVFLGHYSPEPVGDYVAGPNHVLPTGGTARFFSPLGVDQFVRRTSVISYTRKALEREAPGIIKLAEVEGLGAHSRSVEVRMRQNIPRPTATKFDKGDEVGAKRIDIIQDIDCEIDRPVKAGQDQLQDLSSLPEFPERSPGDFPAPKGNRTEGGCAGD
ncbi:MAG TPA: histidinol dehydrogenase [Desulfotomaculum sp.]|nr:histidinol dehydrogenase [Desulfotomaculum sp.]